MEYPANLWTGGVEDHDAGCKGLIKLEQGIVLLQLNPIVLCSRPQTASPSACIQYSNPDLHQLSRSFGVRLLNQTCHQYFPDHSGTLKDKLLPDWDIRCCGFLGGGLSLCRGSSRLEQVEEGLRC